jgi:hypothetical protein
MRALAKKPVSKSQIRSPFFNGKGSPGFFGVQAKLNVGKAGDKYEIEADNMADRLVERTTPNESKSFAVGNNQTTLQREPEDVIQEKPLAQSITPLIQKKEDDDVQTKLEEDKENIQKKEEEEVQAKTDEEEEPIQMKEEEEVQAKTEEEEKPVQKKVEEEVQTKTEEEEKVQLKPEEPIQKQEEEEPIQTKAEEDEEVVQAQSEEKDEPIQKQEEEEVQTKAKDEDVQSKLEDDKETVQKQEDEEVQAKPAGNDISTIDIEPALQQSKGSGSSLPGDLRSNMESQFGADLGGVQIHTDSNAVQMNKGLGAQAFTNKNDIYFNEGKYNPASKSGQHLLAHELTHTIQQGAVPVNTGQGQSEEPNIANTPIPSATSMGRPLDLTAPANNLPEATGNSAGDTIITEPVVGEAKTETTEGQKEKATETKEEGKPTAKEKEAESNYPRSPQDDPAFKAVEQQVGSRASEQRAHGSGGGAAQSAQDAAVSPDNERESTAQAGQVETMDEQEPGEFNAATFKATLMERIASMQLPENEDEADDFENNNNIDEINQQSTQQVSDERAAAAGGIEQATTQEPDTASVEQREPVPLEEPPIGETPASVNAERAIPQPRSNTEVNQPLNENMSEVDQQMAENQVTDEQLANSNEPQFTGALSATNEARANTQNAPQQLRSEEGQVLSGNQQQAEATSQEQLTTMHGTREGVLNNVLGQQTNTGSRDTAERTRIANEINAIYETTKTDVEAILSSLDTTVSEMFTTAATDAKQQFEDYVEEKMDAYKDERYSGLSGAATWVGDVFTGLPDEVNQFFVEGRQVYIDVMDVALTDISEYIAEKLNEAKQRIAQGKQDVTDYVAELPQSLQSIGQEAAENIQSRFDELDESVNSKQDELIDSLAQQYSDSLSEVDARIEEMKAANRGLVDMALDAIGGVIGIIITIKNTLTNLLSAAVEAITAIITDPIGFLGNLLSGVKQGFLNFGSNILRHLTSGLIGWLTGALGPMGITIPDDLFSLKGIFSLVMQILGLTWDFIRKKAVKLLGGPVVSALETGFEIFMIIKNEGIAGLWNYIKEQFNDLKETVMDAIKEMVITKVIEAGIKWVLGLMSPAGAFVKAAMMIIDIVKFFIEKGSQILELVNAFIEGIKAVASGSVGRVATAIENALAKAIPVIIGFLASLLGITGLASKVQSIIKKIRKRIDKAVDKVIMKAKSWFRKLGGKIKGAAARFFQFWKNKKTFRGADGKNHKIYFQGSGNSAVLTVASTPMTLTTFISNAVTGENAEKTAAKTQALALSQQIDTLKATPITGSDEAAKAAKSEEINNGVKEKMDQLAPLLRVLMSGGENSVELVKEYLNKKVTNDDKSVSPDFINAFETEKNKIDGAKVYTITRENGRISRAPNRANEGFLKIGIDDTSGILVSGSEKDYVPAHNKFKPENMRIMYNNGTYTANYETEKRSGEGKQTFTVDITYQQLEAEGADQMENRTVTGSNMQKKPGGMQRGRTDSAGGGFDNAHLIGDQFGGSGYNQGLNIYPSSEIYNRQTMLNQENRLYGDISNAVPFSMTVSANINHLSKFSGNSLKSLLEKEFTADNSGKEGGKEVEDGMTTEMRKKVALDIGNVPGRFESVNYSISQAGNSVPGASIGADSEYENAVKRKLGT